MGSCQEWRKELEMRARSDRTISGGAGVLFHNWTTRSRLRCCCCSLVLRVLLHFLGKLLAMQRWQSYCAMTFITIHRPAEISLLFRPPVQNSPPTLCCCCCWQKEPANMFIACNETLLADCCCCFLAKDHELIQNRGGRFLWRLGVTHSPLAE